VVTVGLVTLLVTPTRANRVEIAHGLGADLAAVGALPPVMRSCATAKKTWRSPGRLIVVTAPTTADGAGPAGRIGPGAGDRRPCYDLVMNARYDIEKLIFTYAELMDAGDLEGVAALFEHAVVTNDKGEAVGGAEALAARWGKSVIIHPDGTPRTRHVTTNLVVDVDEETDTAMARSYVTVFQEIEDELPLQPIFAGTYLDRFARVDGQWRFTERHKGTHSLGDLSRHVSHSVTR
jgi:3-phenylpropionate/cinnamic acid dioxygenase small subunit